MTYQETLQYLYKALPMFQRVGSPAYKTGLENAYALDSYFGFPHKSFKSIHVAGTNGKGSVSHMIASALQEQGYKIGLFTSPHLIDFRERIRVNGQTVPEKYVQEFTQKHIAKFESLGISFFEMTTFMAFAYFELSKVDIAVIEVGLGGRLDTTNVIRPELSIITNIGKDHTQFLGDNLKSIAKEKAGIIKKGVPLVVGESQEETIQVFEDTANSRCSEMIVADQELGIEYSLKNLDGLVEHKINDSLSWSDNIICSDLQGSYQKKNLLTALVSLLKLNKIGIRADENSIQEGFKRVKQNTGLQGRWQEAGNNPLVICDVAHNVEGFTTIFNQISNTPHKQLHMILGFVNDKNLEPILQLLPKNAFYTLCEPRVPRVMKNKELSILFEKHELEYSLAESIQSAYSNTLNIADIHDLIYIGGSTFLVADFLSWKKSENSF